MSLIRLSRLFLPISAILIVASLVVFWQPGPQMSIEFTGGTLMELILPEEAGREELAEAIRTFDYRDGMLQGVHIARTRTGSFFIRTPTLTTDEHAEFLAHATIVIGDIEEVQYTSIGPTVGASLRQRALWAIVAAVVAIILYLAIAFRKIPRHISPWTFGTSAIVALLHDVILTVGIFTIISRYTTFQFDTLFVTALLSIMGYSVNDTIVIFDRIRDNLVQEGKKGGTFENIANKSLFQSISRTIHTSLSTLIMLLALYFLGAESIRWFILALVVGAVIGTYSSFFVATPVLVLWQKWRKS